MFNTTLDKITKRQAYIDQMSQEQISTIKTKDLFIKASQESPAMFKSNKDVDLNQEMMLFSPNLDGPATNLLKNILPAPENSYEQLEQLQTKMKLLTSKELNQVQILKSLFNEQKDQIKSSELKVSDFLQLYESEQMQAQERDMNDPLVKKIIACFEANTKDVSLFELMGMIVEGVSAGGLKEMEEKSQARVNKRIRQSVCELDDRNGSYEEGDDLFNEETKKQMDKILSFYQSTLQTFDIQHEE